VISLWFKSANPGGSEGNDSRCCCCYSCCCCWTKAADNFCNIAVTSQLRSAILDADASHWPKCLSSWMRLQRAASGPSYTVDCSRSDAICELTAHNASLVSHLNHPAVNHFQTPVDDIASKSAVKRPSADLVTFRVSAKCAGRISSFNSQVLHISYLSLKMIRNRIIHVIE